MGIDSGARRLIRGVFLSVDGHLDMWASYGIECANVAEYFHNSSYERSCFSARVQKSDLTPGEHIVALKVVGWDPKTIFLPAKLSVFIT